MKSGTISAATSQAARSKLTGMRLKVVSVTAVAEGGKPGTGGGPSQGILSKFLIKTPDGKTHFVLGGGAPSTKDLAVFSKQFSIMIERGVPLIQTLGILADNQKSPIFAMNLDKIRIMIENGATLSDALSAFPGTFDHLYIAMMRAGEVSGKLDVILRQLVTYIEKAARLKSQLKSAMVYPIIIMTVASGVVTLLLVFVVPTFAKQYKDNGSELPGLTQFVVNASSIMTQNFHFIIAAVIGGLFGLSYWRKTPDGKAKWDRFMLQVPIVSTVIRKVAVGRFCSTMSTMLLSGVSILEALNICAASAGNQTIESFVLRVREKISSGSNFADPLGESDLFPKMVTSMVAVGESTGALDQTLLKIAEIYEEEVDLAVATMKGMIEPIMIVLIGGIVGFIVIAMYLPVFDMAKVAG